MSKIEAKRLFITYYQIYLKWSKYEREVMIPQGRRLPPNCFGKLVATRALARANYYEGLAR